MKKKWFFMNHRCLFACAGKFLKVMKICIFLIAFVSMQTFALDNYAQTKKMDIKIEQSNIILALEKIENQSEFFFFYNNKVVRLDKKVSLDLKDKTINEILDAVFLNTDVEYTINNRQIILSLKNTENSINQQQKSVSGKVTDSSGASLPGVAVIVKGTTTGVITDNSGNFSLSNIPENATLKFSFVGLKSQEVAIGNKVIVNVMLLDEAINLDDVVVVGYGVQKKSNVTGSIVSVKTKEFKDMNLGVTEVLQGRVSGVNVSNGNIIIRGASSINGANPLWIVDGSAGVIPSMDDIESIEVLKDAASTAIYGASGAGGVILVTTKKGKAGKISVHAKATVGIQMATMLPDYLTAEQYVERRLYSGYSPSAGDMATAGWDNPSSLPNTRWNDLLFRNALKQDYYINLSGGSEQSMFTSTLQYSNNVDNVSIGSPVNQELKFRISNISQITKKLKLTSIANISYLSSEGHNTGGLQPRATPMMVPYNRNNPLGGWGTKPVGNLVNAFNPMMDAMYTTNISNNSTAHLNIILDYQIIDGLLFQANLTGSGNGGGGKSFNPISSAGELVWQSKLRSNNGSGAFAKMFYTLNYSKTFAEKHYVGALIGYEASKSLGLGTYAEGVDFPINPAWNIALAGQQNPASGSRGESFGQSQFGRLNYAYKEKYLIESTVRRDGYSQFGPDNRYGIFPSMSAGWNIGKERFISDNANWVSNMKLRGGYGSIGNSTVPAFLYQSSWTNTKMFYYPGYGDKVFTPFRYDKMPNSGIKWETVTQLDFGIDVGLLKNKINLSVEWYNKNTSDMLYPVSLPPSSAQHMGSTSTQTPYITNIGQINNKGFDFMIQYRNKIKDFNYDVAFTASTNVNKVVKLSDDLNPIIWKNGSDWHPMNTSMYRTENGMPMGQMYGYKVVGIFQSDAEIKTLNDAITTSSNGSFKNYQQPGTAAGDLKYLDKDGDGKITSNDMEVIGNPWPKLVYGTNINLSWKNFELSMGWLGNYGVDVYNAQKMSDYNIFQTDNATTKIFDTWSPTNKGSKNPRLIYGDPNQNFSNQSSYFIEDGSFLKLKTFHLGYSIPQSVLSKAKIKGLTVFVNCINLLTFSKLDFDPELGGGYLERNSVGTTRMPSTATVICGFSLTL